MVTRATVLITLILLILPAAALAVSNVELYYQDAPLTYLPDAHEITAELRFTSTPTITQVTIFQAVGAGRVGERTVGTASATSSAAITIRPQQTVTIYFEYNSEQSIHTFTLPKDEQAPIIQELSINGCEDECAYSQASTLRAVITDPGPSGVRAQSVQATFAGTSTALTCNQEGDVLVCEQVLTGTTSGELRVEAADRAGNQAQPQTLQLNYDNTPPQITQAQFIDLYGGVATGLEIIPGGVPAVLDVTVYEQTTPRARLETSFGAEEVECEETDEPNEYTCSISINPPNQALEEEALLNVTDQAGNSRTQTISLRVEESNQEATPMFWQANTYPLRRVDHQTWAVNPLYLPIAINLEKQTAGTPQPIYIHARDCDVKGAHSPTGAGKVHINPQPGKQTELVLRINAQGERALNPESELLTNPEITCELDVYSRLAGVAYTNPQRINITVRPQFLTALPPAPKAIREQAEQAREKAEGISQTYLAVRQITDAVRFMCRPPRALDQTGRVLAGGAAALYPIPGAQVAAEKLNTGAESLTDASESVLGFIGGNCEMLTCPLRLNSTGNNFLESFNIGVEDTFATAAGVDHPHQLLDPYKSIVVAASTMCVPAILFHYEQIQAVRCAQYECQSQIPYGLTSADACAYGARESMCALVGGHIINALPAANIANSAAQRYATAFSDPLSLVGLVSTAGCRWLPGGRVHSATCKVQRGGERAGKVASAINTIDNFVAQTRNVGQSREDYCRAIQDRVDQRRPTDYRPFEFQDTCRGAYSVYEEAGNRYITINGEVCQVTTQELPGQGLDPENEAYQSVTGMQLDCKSPRGTTAAQTARAQHQTCLDDGLITDFASTDAGQEFFVQKDEYDNIKSQYEEAEDQYLITAQDITNIIIQQNNALTDYENTKADFISQQAGDFGNLIPIGENNFIDVGNLPRAEQIQQGDLTPEQREFLTYYDEVFDFQGFQTNEQLIQDKEEELLVREEQRQEQVDALRAQEKILEEKTKEAMLEMQRAELSTTPGFMKGLVGSMAGYGRLGATLDRLSGGVVANTGFGGFFQDASQTIAGLSELGGDFVGQQICSATGNEPPKREAALQSRTNRPLAHISGIRTPYGSTSAYRVDVGVAHVTNTAATARIYLRGAGNQEYELAPEITLNNQIRNVGADAFPAVLAETYTHACIAFSHPIEELFAEPNTIGDTTKRTLCARLKVNPPR